MRKLLFLTPMVALSACSFFNPTAKHSTEHAGYGQYQQIQGQQFHGQQFHGQQFHGQQYQANQFQASQFQAPVNVGQSYSQGNTRAGHANYAQAPQLRGPQLHSDLRKGKAGQFYGTIGAVKYEDAVESYGLEGRIGYDTGRIIGAEVEGSIGISDENDTITIAGTGDIELSAGYDYNLAAFAVARLPIGQRLSIHARGGYDVRSFTTAAVDAANSGNAAKFKVDLDGFAYGLGGQYALNSRDGLRLDFTRYESQGRNADSVSASYTRKF